MFSIIHTLNLTRPFARATCKPLIPFDAQSVSLLMLVSFALVLKPRLVLFQFTGKLDDNLVTALQTFNWLRLGGDRQVNNLEFTKASLNRGAISATGERHKASDLDRL